MKVLHGKKLESMVAAVAAIGFDFDQEVSTDFKGLSEMVSSLKSENEELKIKCVEIDEAVNSAVSIKDEEIFSLSSVNADISTKLKELEEKNKKNLAEALAADRDTPAIDKLASDSGPSAREVWASMPSSTLDERKQKSTFYNENVRKG